MYTSKGGYFVLENLSLKGLQLKEGICSPQIKTLQKLIPVSRCDLPRECDSSAHFKGLSVHVFAEKEKEVEQFLQECDVSRLMQDLIGNYILMEEYFMREMVLKVSNSYVFL